MSDRSTGDAREPGEVARPSVLLPSRLLGPLLGLAALSFDIHSPPASEASVEGAVAEIVRQARVDRIQALVVVGVGQWAIALAVQSARVGLTLVVLDVAADTGLGLAYDWEHGWLAALGARVVPVQASWAAIDDAAPGIARAAGLRLVAAACGGPPHPTMGLLCPHGPPTPSPYRGRGGEPSAVSPSPAHRERDVGAGPERCRSVGACEPKDVRAAQRSGGEGRDLVDRLLVLSSEPAELPRLVFGGVRIDTIVGGLEGPVDLAPDDGVVRARISVREADAARALLAREEGLMVSRTGAVGMAALLGVMRADRGRKPSERQVDPKRSVVIALSGERIDGGGEPPVSADRLPVRPVSLGELASSLRAVLVEPPGRAQSSE